MITFPNAKINLGLNIVSKRPDGYHNLETIFYPVAIKDALEIIPSKDGKDSFIQQGIKVDALPENNLVIKALRLMREEYDIPPLEIHLLKKIPFGAGLGGGSADAAFMLQLLNKFCSLNVDDATLVTLALQLGADCPFFIYNRPMFAKGIGEQLEEINLNLEEYYLVVIKPDIHIPTKDAFAEITPQQPPISLKEIVALPVEEWKSVMVNDFEQSIFPKYPRIKGIKQRLYGLGAVYASMSGSGSSVYGIFTEPTSLKREFNDCFVWEEEKS
ncbi:MAG: 4-(cytidine 5'-diphospho)-2-C-methyl-D-erythritol kinase [Dysgonomonas sp.]